MDLKQTGWESVDWIHRQVVGCCKHSTEPSSFSTRWDTISISTCTRQHGVTYGQVPYWTQTCHSARTHTRTHKITIGGWLAARRSGLACHQHSAAAPVVPVLRFLMPWPSSVYLVRNTEYWQTSSWFLSVTSGKCHTHCNSLYCWVAE